MERHDLPRTPRSIEELGIPVGVVHDLAMRRALYEGRTSTVRLSEGLGISMAIMSKVVEELRDLRLLDLLGMEGRDYIFDLTEQGREHARERASLCRYAGHAPVSIIEYSAMVLRQAAPPSVTRESMKRAFSDLVVSDRMIDELGPALLTEGAMFLYGPPGTGKTSVAERLIRTHDEPVIVPRCVEIDSQIITVFDPLIHEPLDDQPKELDPRWVLCRRPSIVAGGELTGSMMDLTYEPNSGVYLAPIQMQANNGLLVIDDFGRQGISPEALLNRWIVPLDRRIDFLSLTYGVRFEVPFDVKVVFSTNLDPATLGDEAFFRRIQNKILVSSISDAEFDAVLSIAAGNSGITITPGAADHLRHVSRELGDGDLRPYLPKEVCKILKAVCQFNDAPLVLDNDGVDRVAAIYFTRAGELRSAEAEAASAAGMFHTPGATAADTPPAAPAGAAPAHPAPAHAEPLAVRPTPADPAPPPGATQF
ncbi:MAG: ATP-binding protein [Acidimicrobiales bacterium]